MKVVNPEVLHNSLKVTPGSYLDTKNARLSASPQPGGAAANSINMRVPPIMSPHVKPLYCEVETFERT